MEEKQYRERIKVEKYKIDSYYLRQNSVTIRRDLSHLELKI